MSFIETLSGEFLAQQISLLNVRTLHVFGFFYNLLGFLSFVFLVLLCFLPAGKIKLGPHKPAYNRISWVTMLYSTGMGAGLLLRAVQEPLYYFQHPPIGEGSEIQALKYTFHHWGFTAWSFYGLFGLFCSYFYYNSKKHKYAALFGNTESKHPVVAGGVRFFIIISTLLGVIAALTLGATQWAHGLNYLTDIPLSTLLVSLVVLGLVGIATLSALSGLRKGVQLLSNINVFLAIFVMIGVLFAGEYTRSGILFGQAFWAYLVDFVPVSLNTGAHKVQESFLMDWTYFYWAFWISWAPFTGLFIAKVSAGRSLREFVFFVLLAPSLGSFLWFSVYSSEAFYLASKGVDLRQFDSIYNSFFVFLGNYKLGLVFQWILLINIATFLITSLDSAFLILADLVENPKPKSTNRRIFIYAFTTLAIATLLVLSGQEKLLATVSQLLILSAAPISFIYIYNFIKLIGELRSYQRR